MRFVLLICLALLALAHPAVALGTAMAEAPGLLCRRAIAAAEKAHEIPPHLLAAIGRTESGRRDPVSGDFHPWPWTINAEGEGHFFETKAQAIAAVRALQSRGVKSVDVGCMQVNLMHHPTAFASLEQAFDPSANAEYAARFLRSLQAQTGTWPAATGMYHSATPELAEPYRKQVLAAWPNETKNQLAVGAAPLTALASAWSATTTMNHSVLPPFQRGPMARVIPLARATDGSAPPGRDLAAYRAAPVFIASRTVLRRGG